MIMFMYKKICITNRHLVSGDFLEQIEKVVKSDADIIILREKDLSTNEYENLARQVIKLCNDNGKICILHSFIDVAIKLKHPFIHLTMDAFREYSASKSGIFVFNTIHHSINS